MQVQMQCNYDNHDYLRRKPLKLFLKFSLYTTLQMPAIMFSICRPYIDHSLAWIVLILLTRKKYSQEEEDMDYAQSLTTLEPSQ